MVINLIVGVYIYIYIYPGTFVHAYIIYGCTSTIGSLAQKRSPIFQAPLTNLEETMLRRGYIYMDDSGIV